MYIVLKPNKARLEEQLEKSTARIRELESALFGGETKVEDLRNQILGNNVVHVITGTSKEGSEILGVYLDEVESNNAAAQLREVYDQVNVEPWLVQITGENKSDNLSGRDITYYHGQKVSYEDDLEGSKGVATVLSADYEYQKSPEEILYKIVPEGFPFVDQYAKIVTGSEIKGFVK